MTSPDKDWIYESRKEDLARYLKDGIDLSSSINAGQRISDLRNLADISVQELAESCGISPQELLALESGIMNLNASLASLLARKLGVSDVDLYVSDESME
ncbi:MAG: helix-turn-helix transcriptional regulator [Granulosicoccus sp.]